MPTGWSPGSPVTWRAVRHRPFGAILLSLLAVGLVAAGCGSGDGSAGDGSAEASGWAQFVAEVDGTAISAAELTDELDAVRADFRWQVVEDQQRLDRQSVDFHFGPVSTVEQLDEAPFRTEAVAGIVDRMIDDRLVRTELERRGATVEDGDRDRAAAQSSRDPDSPYRGREIERFARQLALGRALAAAPEDVEASVLARAYELVLPREGAVCVSHILLATTDDAAFVVAQLRSGFDFAEAAATVSLDPSTSGDGGALGCIPRGGLPEDLGAIEQAAWDAEVGEVVGPVETERGFHVLVVTGYEPAFEDAAPLLARSPDLLAVAWVRLARETAEVVLPADLGTWDPQGIVPAVEAG